MNLESLPSILTNPVNSEQARFIVDVTKLTYIEVGRNDEIGEHRVGPSKSSSTPPQYLQNCGQESRVV
jgi:hypothetical protein